MKSSQTFGRCQDRSPAPTDWDGLHRQNGSRSALFIWGVEVVPITSQSQDSNWSLDIEAFYSLPIFGTNPLPTPSTFSILLCYGALLLPLDWRQLSCLIHLCEPTVFHDGALLVSSLLLLLPPYYIWKNTHLTRQISPPTIKLGMPHSLRPRQPCSYGEHWIS